MKLVNWFQRTPLDGQRSILFIRILAGGVFFWEGMLKFVYVNQGVGRFTKLGLPFPDIVANFIGGFEIVGGLCLLLGLITRWVGVAFATEMLVAMIVTKIGLYLGASPLPLPPSPPQVGGWAVLHEIRSEYAQLMSSIFLIASGPGRWSLDAWFSRNKFFRTLITKMNFQGERMKGVLQLVMLAFMTLSAGQAFALTHSFTVNCEGPNVALVAQDRSVCGIRQGNEVRESFSAYSTVMLGSRTRCSFPGLFDDRIQLTHEHELDKFVILGPLAGDAAVYGTPIHVAEAPFEFSYNEDIYGNLVHCSVTEN